MFLENSVSVNNLMKETTPDKTALDLNGWGDDDLLGEELDIVTPDDNNKK